jgi:DNA-binding NarL/FixJ family response regulator
MRLMQPEIILLNISMMALSGDKLASLIRDYCYSSCIPVAFDSFNDERSLLGSVTASGVPGYTLERDLVDLRIKMKTGYR